LHWDAAASEATTMNITPGEIIAASWLLFAGYWLIAALGSKKAAKKERSGERVGHIIFMALGFFLLYRADPRFGLLNLRLLPEKSWIDYLGAALTLAGVLFAIWARYTIGKEWSAEIQIKQGHELIRSGPYAHIRHPIYTGILLALVGTALSIGEYRGIVAVALFLVGFVRKARREEKFLASEFGRAFDDHRRHTGFFLPRFS
jgi:protein-S-isoprenylcysteine O-methyltransferase Ste14